MYLRLIRHQIPIKTTHLLTIEIIISGTSNCRSIIEVVDAVRCRQPSSPDSSSCEIHRVKLRTRRLGGGMRIYRAMKIERRFFFPVPASRRYRVYDRREVATARVTAIQV